MHKKNPTYVDKPHQVSAFFTSKSIYQTIDGNETDDISQAHVVNGIPVFLRYEKSDEKLPICKEYPVTTDFSDEHIIQAQTALAEFNRYKSVPQVYVDKFDALKYAENTAHTIINNINKPNTNIDAE